MGYRCFRQEHGQDYHRTYGWCHYSAKHTKRIISILWSTIHSFYKHDRVWCTHKRKARHFLYLYLCYRLNAQSLLRLRRGVVSLLCKTCVWSYVYVYIIMLINCRFHLLDRQDISSPDVNAVAPFTFFSRELNFCFWCSTELSWAAWLVARDDYKQHKSLSYKLHNRATTYQY